MSAVELYAMIGAVAAIAVIVGGIIARDRHIQKQMTDGDEICRKLVRDLVEASVRSSEVARADLNARLDRIREDYVRRTDLDGHLTRIDATLSNMNKEVRDGNHATTQRLDQLFAYLSQQPPPKP